MSHSILLHLSLIPGAGPQTVFKLLRHLYHDAYPDVLHAGWTEIIESHTTLDFSKIYAYSISDFMRYAELTERQAKSLADGLSDHSIIDQELERAARHNVSIITLLDDGYPELLKQIYSPPLVLYCQGSFRQGTEKYIAIVGSRKSTDYAAHVIDELVPGLVAQGWYIVSGGAEGADTMAHHKTLDVQGTTIAILGSGLLQPYPSSNINLFKKICDQGGAVISPFPLNTPPDRPHFPARNRIIAGMSLGSIVIQAAEKSGALITAQCALEQGRQVFAVPGQIHNELSAGCHNLIKQGAKLVHTVNDILEEFSESYQPIIHHQQNIVDGTTKTGKQPAPVLNIQIDPILTYLVKPATLDELIFHTGMPITDLQDRLFQLQLEGKVYQTFAGTWECNKD